jgi:UDP-N-acetyl-D-galactosamine dehydrogenase
MGAYLGQRLVKLLVQANLATKGARVGILGLTFKENVSDLRNSRVPDIVAELQQFGINPLVHDPIADVQEAQQEYGVHLVNWQDLSNLDALILAVTHQAYLDMPRDQLLACVRPGGVLMDVKSAFDPSVLPATVNYWSL